MNETTQNTSDSQVVTMLDAGVLVPFQNQPFRVATGEEMDQLKESIQEYGVLSPLLWSIEFRKLQYAALVESCSNRRGQRKRLRGISTSCVLLPSGQRGERLQRN